MQLTLNSSAYKVPVALAEYKVQLPLKQAHLQCWTCYQLQWQLLCYKGIFQIPWKRSTYIAFSPVVENAQTYLMLKGLELKARKKKQEKGKGRELICSNTHGSVTEKLHSVTKLVNINEKYCILL